MNRIQKMSFYLIVVFNFLLIAIPLLIVLQWSLVDWEPFKQVMAPSRSIVFDPIQTPEGVIHFVDLKLTFLSKSIGFLGSMLGWIPVFLSIIILKQLFHHYRQGNIFSFENAKKYQYLGVLFFLEGLFAKPLSEMFLVLAATLSNPPGHRYLTLGFGSPNIESLFCGLLVLVISWVMMEGYKLQDDQKLTI